MVGAAVGLCVLVGVAELGWLVGRADTDGAAVGLLLGWAEGALEGCDDGGVDGMAVGRRVGPAFSVVNLYAEFSVITLVFVIDSTVRLNGTLFVWKMSSSLRWKPAGKTEKDKS